MYFCGSLTDLPGPEAPPSMRWRNSGAEELISLFPILSSLIPPPLGAHFSSRFSEPSRVERSLIRERVKAGLVNARAKGKNWDGPALL